MRRSSTGFLTLLAIGGFYAWRNRFKIQRFLEAQGVDVPLSTRNLKDTIQSGVAKISGSTENVMKNIESEPVQKAV